MLPKGGILIHNSFLFFYLDTHIYNFQNTLDSETFVKVLELLGTPSKFTQIKDSLQTFLEKLEKKIKSNWDSFNDKEDYIITKEVKM